MKWTTRKAVISLVLGAGMLASSVLAQDQNTTGQDQNTTAAAPNTATPGQQVLPLSMGFTTPNGDANSAEELKFDDNGDGVPDRTVNADAQFPEDLNGLKPTEASEGYASPGTNPGYQATWTTTTQGADGNPDPNKPAPNITSDGGPIADTEFKDPGGYQIGNHSIASKTPPPNISDPPPEVTSNTPDSNDPNAPQDPNNPPAYEGQSNILIHDNTPPGQQISFVVLDESVGEENSASEKTSTDGPTNMIVVTEEPKDAAIKLDDPQGISGKTVKADVTGANFQPAQAETAQVMAVFGNYNADTGAVDPVTASLNTLPYPANNAVINVQNEFEFVKNQRVRVEFKASDQWAAAKDLKVDIQVKVLPEEGSAERASFEKDPSGGAGVLTIRDKDTKVKLTFIAKDVATHPSGQPNTTYTTVTFRVKDTGMIVDRVGAEEEGDSQTTNAPTAVEIPDGGD